MSKRPADDLPVPPAKAVLPAAPPTFKCRCGKECTIELIAPARGGLFHLFECGLQKQSDVQAVVSTLLEHNAECRIEPLVLSYPRQFDIPWLLQQFDSPLLATKLVVRELVAAEMPTGGYRSILECLAARGMSEALETTLAYARELPPMLLFWALVSRSEETLRCLLNWPGVNKNYISNPHGSIYNTAVELGRSAAIPLLAKGGCPVSLTNPVNKLSPLAHAMKVNSRAGAIALMLLPKELVTWPPNDLCLAACCDHEEVQAAAAVCIAEHPKRADIEKMIDEQRKK